MCGSFSTGLSLGGIMVLKITDSSKTYGLNICVMTLEEFSRKESHLYIATENWERIEVDICEKTPAGYLNQMSVKCPIVPVVLEINPKVLMRLCEMYPNDRAYLRSHYNKGLEAFETYLKNMDERYSWSSLITK